MKKFPVKILLVIIIILSSLYLFSCSNDTNENNVTATDNGAADNLISGDDSAPVDEEPEYVGDDLGEYDFGGYIFRSITRSNNIMLELEELTGEILNDAQYARNRRIEERFNITLAERMIPSDQFAAPMRTSLLAGERAYDVMVIRGPNAFDFAAEGLLHPFTDLPHADLSKPYWDAWLTAQWSVANKVFFAAGAYDTALYGNTVALLFNKQLAQDLALESPFSIVHAGKWTIDKFGEMAKAANFDLNGDGVITADDRHGFVASTRTFQPAMWIGLGTTTIAKDSDDIPYLSATGSAFIDAWFKMADVLIDGGAWFSAPDPNLHPDTLSPEIFKNGRALFMHSGLGGIEALRDMETDFGIVPYPKMNEQQDKYYSSLAWVEILSLPIYADDDDLARTSVILEALASDSYRTVVPVYTELVLRTRNARDDESEEMIDSILGNRVFDWGDAVWTPLLRDGIFPTIWPRQTDTVVSRLERAENNIQKTIDGMVDMFLALD
jgi:hypothetical protein